MLVALASVLWACLETTRPAQLDDPGYRNVDASLFRTFKIHEALKLPASR